VRRGWRFAWPTFDLSLGSRPRFNRTRREIREEPNVGEVYFGWPTSDLSLGSRPEAAFRAKEPPFAASAVCYRLMASKIPLPLS
jgi:hypothetical protein